MEDYNTRPPRRGSFFGSGMASGSRPRRGSFFGFHWAEEDGSKTSPDSSGRESLGERYREMEHVSSQQRRGSFFGHLHHSTDKEEHHHQHHHTEKRRASMFGSSADDHHHHHHQRRGSLFSGNRRGSIGPMATLSSVTAKSRRSSMGFFSRNNKIFSHEPKSQELAYQVMAAFADFDVWLQ